MSRHWMWVLLIRSVLYSKIQEPRISFLIAKPTLIFSLSSASGQQKVKPGCNISFFPIQGSWRYTTPAPFSSAISSIAIVTIYILQQLYWITNIILVFLGVLAYQTCRGRPRKGLGWVFLAGLGFGWVFFWVDLGAPNYLLIYSTSELATQASRPPQIAPKSQNCNLKYLNNYFIIFSKNLNISSYMPILVYIIILECAVQQLLRYRVQGLNIEIFLNILIIATLHTLIL